MSPQTRPITFPHTGPERGSMTFHLVQRSRRGPSVQPANRNCVGPYRKKEDMRCQVARLNKHQAGQASSTPKTKYPREKSSKPKRGLVARASDWIRGPLCDLTYTLSSLSDLWNMLASPLSSAGLHGSLCVCIPRYPSHVFVPPPPQTHQHWVKLRQVSTHPLFFFV